MSQGEKKLLLKDLCARLSYGVLFMVPDINEPVELLSINPKRDKPLEIDDGHDENSSTYWNLEDVTPYLRPMSSATEKEMEEFEELFIGYSISRDRNCIYRSSRGDLNLGFIDWLITHQFDYRGLIPMGLALPATEGMYNIK